MYGIKLNEDKEFTDMAIVASIEGTDISAQFSKPIIYAPKRIVRGTNAGKPDYVRRENVTIFGFVPDEILNPVSAPPYEIQEEEEVSV